MSVIAETKRLTSYLNKVQRKQIPFATSKALNETAFAVRSSLQRSLPHYLDRPTGNIQNILKGKAPGGIIGGVQVDQSKKKKLVATVGFVGRGFRTSKWAVSPAEIMHKHIVGGTRHPHRRAIAVPVSLKTNRYGNIGRNKINKLMQNKEKHFSGVPKGGKHAGIYQRMKKGLKMLIAWEDKAVYQGGRFPFRKIVTTSIKRNYRRKFDKALQWALKNP